MLRFLTPFFLAVVLVPTAALVAREEPRDVTVDDYFSVASVSDLAVSPDGKNVAYSEFRWLKSSDDRKADLWVVSTGKGRPRRLTSDRANDRHPHWAADGRSIYVLGNRKREAEKKAPYDGKTQIWQIPLDGDPKPVTRIEGGIVAFDYAPEANALYYTVDAKETDKDAFSKLRATHDKLDYGHGERKVSELYRLDTRTWLADKIYPVGSEKKYIREFTVTPDGKRIAMLTASDDSVIRSEGDSRVEVLDEATGKVTPTDESWRKTAGSPYPWLEGLAWNRDGSRLAYVTVFDAYPAEVIINSWKDGKASASRLVRPEGVHVRGYGSPLRWLGNELHWLGEAEASVGRLRYNPATGTNEGKIEPGVVVTAFDIAGESRTVIDVRGTKEAFPELVAPDGTALTDLNPRAKKWKLPSVKHITWNAPDGSRVGGILELPAGYKEGTKLPLIVGIHGGPTTSVLVNRQFDMYDGRLLFAANGYAVLCPNYRGSTGYGDRFLKDLVGNENDVDVKDILAGIQHLIKEGIADPDRVGVMGWSNGGYLTNCLITLKDAPVKIRAASSGAGILDCVAEWGFNDEPAYPMVFKKGLPWETPEVYRKTSPTYGLGNVTTPTLIHVGANDERCPPGHSRMLYRALKEYRKVPTQLIVYPNEPHGLGKYRHRQAKMEWDLAWFKQYLLGAKSAK